MATGNEDAALDPSEVIRLVEHEPYDPSDQFFQAYRAGYLRSYSGPGRPSEQFLWHNYMNWLYEESQ